MSTQHSPGGVVASDGTSGRMSPEVITDLGIQHGVYRKDERASVLARAKADPGGTLTAICARLRPARPVTPATPATARSGPAVAAGSAPTPDYPAGWAPSVAAARRTPGVRTAATKVARAAQRVAGQVHAAGDGPRYAAQVRAQAEAAMRQAQARTHDTFYDKSPKVSAAAADHQARHQAELDRMAAERRARGIG